MTQIIVTLEQGADSTLLQRMIENMKGVLSASLSPLNSKSKDEDTDEWIDRMRKLSEKFDSSLIDMSDERTRYLMSK